MSSNTSGQTLQESKYRLQVYHDADGSTGLRLTLSPEALRIIANNKIRDEFCHLKDYTRLVHNMNIIKRLDEEAKAEQQS